MSKRETAQITMRIPVGILEALDECAKGNRRTRSAQVIVFICSGLDASSAAIRQKWLGDEAP